MTTRECFDRLAAVGVRVEGHPANDTHLALWYDDGFKTFMALDRHNDHFEPDEWLVEAMLCNAVLEKWPHWTVEHYSMDTFVVYDGDEDGDKVAVVSGKPAAPSRLAALTLAAEVKHKENSDAR